MSADVSNNPDPDRGAVELSVILPTRNGADHISDQLDSLARQTWDGRWELVIVDNGSTDETPSILRNWCSISPVDARVITAADHFSLAYARNCGVGAAHGLSVAFVDDDDVVDDGWVAAMGVCLRHQELVGSSFDYALLNDPVAAEQRGTFQQTELGRVLGVPVVSGGGSGCRRTLWDHLGGNSLDFYRSGEDIDFSLRALIYCGVEPVLCTDAVYHVRLRTDAWSSYRQGFRFARAGVRQYRLYGSDLDARAESILDWIRRIGGLVLRLPLLTTAGGRAKWMWQLGTRVGRITGSCAERVWFP